MPIIEIPIPFGEVVFYIHDHPIDVLRSALRSFQTEHPLIYLMIIISPVVYCILRFFDWILAKAKFRTMGKRQREKKRLPMVPKLHKRPDGVDHSMYPPGMQIDRIWARQNGKGKED
jgi:hypothetical protein